MSHLKERTERNCLNCNAIVHGRYCSVCGQENLEPQEGVGHLVSHFFNDITHFDGKFFSSLKYLIFKPGFLSEEYMLGRRNSYLNPVRLYIFTSFIFFFIYFGFISPIGEKVSMRSRLSATDSAAVARKNDSIRKAAVIDSINRTKNKDMIITPTSIDVGDNLSIGKNYSSRKEYDSLLKAGAVKDNFFEKQFNYQMIRWNEKYGNDPHLINQKIGENFEHNVPQIFVLSLPLLALMLKLLYFRRKKFYYVSHIIFSIHLFVFVYIAALLVYGLNALSTIHYLGWLRFIKAAVIISIFYYWYKAMRNFYGQGVLKTLFKFFAVLISLFIIGMIAMSAIFIFAFYKT